MTIWERLKHWWQRLAGAPEPDLGISRQPDPQLGHAPRWDPRWPVE